MRYYEIHPPDDGEIGITTRLRGLRNLPEGTRVFAIVTERDGSLADIWEIPVVAGRPQLHQLGNRNSHSAQGRY